MNTDIHRLLDEAFAGIEMTPDTQDLKEEVRANLIARVAELEASGVPATDAASRAVTELGDVRELLGEAVTPRAKRDGYDAAAYAVHRVRPKAGFVVRTVAWALAVVVGLTLGTLGATGILPVPIGLLFLLLGITSTGAWMLVGDALSQETTTNHPMPQPRAAGYGVATFLGVFGLGLVGLILTRALPVWTVVFAAVGVIGAIILYAFLGATQTNRHKAWTRQAHADMPPNRFETEPETAARFGIYSAAIWLVTFGLIVLLVFTVGWWWAPLAFLGGLAAMMLVLARMMFAPRKER
ncbi:permease prefix domain 1-containing protein [Microbacterium elymi]|uniref:Permease prefix domain 1-containing protein n=1 Tax=Microbacterium elymi TaxID=2909587 RepID=A0ABY5NIA2_9MICO|nr:permease prefix domain 1-containing protein [Microbacterium elymi]UUT34826.1 permease prefix domain 1-containing protein [Microbacterium elymi]